MTRLEFDDDITTFSELYELCNNMRGCYVMEDVYDEYGRDECINDNLSDMARYADSWEELKSQLDDIPTGYDWYHRDDDGEWRGIDDEFDEWKDEVREWMEDNDAFEEDDDDEDCEEPAYQPIPFDFVPVEHEDCSFEEVFASSTILKATIRKPSCNSGESHEDLVPLSTLL